MKKCIVAATTFFFVVLGPVFSSHADEKMSSMDEEDIVKSLFFNDWQDFIKKGKVELVMKPEYAFFQDDGEGEHESELDIELETFPGENWELELELGALKYIDEEGDDSELDISDIELDLEYRFFHSFDPVVDLRAGFGVEQPLSGVDSGVSDGLRKFGPHVSARWKLRDFHLFSRIGYEFVDRDSGHGEENDQFEYQVDGFYPLNRWRLGFELHGETDEFDGGDEHELTIAPEVRWRRDDLEIGLGVPVGLTNDAPDYGVFLQVYAGFDLRHGNAATEKHNVFRRR